MKIKIDAEKLICEQTKNAEQCVELLGKGKYSVAKLEMIVKELKNINKSLEILCSTTTTITSTSYGGSTTQMEVPTITQSKLYKENQFLIFALSQQIDIAKTNNLYSVSDFNFTENQILNYGHIAGIIS